MSDLKPNFGNDWGGFIFCVLIMWKYVSIKHKTNKTYKCNVKITIIIEEDEINSFTTKTICLDFSEMAAYALI